MGESGADIVDQLRKVSDDRGLDDARSAELAILLAEADINLINGSNERVQLEAWASQVGAIMEE